MPGLVFLKASPIGDTHVDALPVRSFGPAIAYYTNVLGFQLKERGEKRALLVRDDAEIGLEINGENPEMASVYFAVSDVAALRAELEAKDVDPSPLRDDEYEGNTYRVCFAQEPFGVCFCFGQQI